MTKQRVDGSAGRPMNEGQNSVRVTGSGSRVSAGMPVAKDATPAGAEPVDTGMPYTGPRYCKKIRKDGSACRNILRQERNLVSGMCLGHMRQEIVHATK